MVKTEGDCCAGVGQQWFRAGWQIAPRRSTLYTSVPPHHECHTQRLLKGTILTIFQGWHTCLWFSYNLSLNVKALWARCEIKLSFRKTFLVWIMSCQSSHVVHINWWDQHSNTPVTNSSYCTILPATWQRFLVFVGRYFWLLLSMHLFGGWGFKIHIPKLQYQCVSDAIHVWCAVV